MDKKKIIRRSLEVAVLIVLVVVFVIVNDSITEDVGKTFVPIPDNSKYAYQVESINIEDDKLVLRGWFVETRKTRNTEVTIDEDKNLEIILYDVNSAIEKDIEGKDKPRKGYQLDISYQTRNDIDDYLKCEYDYSNCGFIARLDKTLIDLDSGTYQVVFRLGKKGTVYTGLMSNAYIDKGKLVFGDINSEMKLDVENTDLESIVNEGICLYSNSQHHVCVYQFGWALYWIADDQFAFEDNGRTLIQCIIETSQYDKLSDDRIEKGLFYGDISDYFETCEITDSINCGNYRVMTKELPKDYSVTYITTRCRNGNIWVWESKFRPNYLLKSVY